MLKKRERGAGPGRAVRDRQRPLYVYVTDAERDRIAARAAAAGLSMSAYLRVAAVSAQVRGLDALRAARDLHRTVAELAAVATLLRAQLHGGASAVSSLEFRRLAQALEAAAAEVRARALEIPV